MEEMIQRISKIYLTYGIKSVTMDDLARELGLSKKTLYQHFKDKNDVVNKAMTHLMHIQKCSINEALEQENQNAIDELFGLSRQIAEHLQSLNPAITYDLQKYYPKIWNGFIDYKKQTIYEYIIRNFEKGIREGLFANDIDYEIIALIYVSRMEMYGWTNPGNLSNYSFEHIFKTLFIYHIRGISNNSGLKYLNQLMKSFNKDHNT